MQEIKQIISQINLSEHMEAIHYARADRLVKEASGEIIKARSAREQAVLWTEILHDKLFAIMLHKTPRKFLKILQKLGL